MTAVIALSVTVLLGYIAQRCGICMVRATRNTLKGDPVLLVAILLSGVWVWLYAVAAYFNDWTLPFVRYQLHPVFMIGGFLFGVGASINQACSISTMIHLAQGHLGKFFTITGWFLGWSLWTQIIQIKLGGMEHETLELMNLNNTLLVSVSVLVMTLFFVLKFKPPIKLMLGVLGIGLIASLLFYLVPGWPPSQLMNDMSNAIYQDQAFPSPLRMGIIVALLTGMWISVLVSHTAKLRFPKWPAAIRFLSAGTLMGIGVGMALGGNDTQLLFGIPATSPGALSAILFMFIGIACEQVVFQRGGMFYQRS